MSSKMTTLQQLIKNTCKDIGDHVQYRSSYSGRGMFGRQCIGVVGSLTDCMTVIGQVIKELNKMQKLPGANASMGGDRFFENSVDNLMSFSKDNMAYEVILYWEDLEPIEETDEVEED